MDLFTVWIAFTVVTAIAAAARGRSAFGWLILGALFSVFALIAVLVLPRMDDATVAGGGVFGIPSPATHVKCPDCRELVLKEARKCKHCGCALVPQA